MYANIHNDYVWNDKKIQNVGDKEIGNNSIILSGGTSFYFALNSESVYYRGSLSTNLTTKDIEKIQIDRVDDATLRNVYYHIVFVINGNNKKMYIDGKEVLNVDASRNDVVSNITWNLFPNWSANIMCVRIYNKALSVEEIQTNYEATVKKYES